MSDSILDSLDPYTQWRHDVDEKEKKVVVKVINVFASGWLEDGRLGVSSQAATRVGDTKLEPVPLPAFDPTISSSVIKISAGSRHSLFQVENDSVLIVGLNQRALCESPGHDTPRRVPGLERIESVNVHAGAGVSFVQDRSGDLYSWGCGDYGVLGHGDEDSSHVPRMMLEFRSKRVELLALGERHCLALVRQTAGAGGAIALYSWGRNHCGQLGRGSPGAGAGAVSSSSSSSSSTSSSFLATSHDREYRPGLVSLAPMERAVDVSAGSAHSVAIVSIKRADGKEEKTVYCWGDDSRCQVGDCDSRRLWSPQEYRALSRKLKKMRVSVGKVMCGGWHSMALTEPGGYLLAWGCGEHGQLGAGQQFDEKLPQLVHSVHDIVCASAGQRHSACVDSSGKVYTWGYNAYGELGLGDSMPRLIPTQLTAFRRSTVKEVSCGDRHTLFMVSPGARRAIDEPILRTYFDLASEGGAKLRSVLRADMESKGLDPDIIDHPYSYMPGQPGMATAPVKNDVFEGGLRYCMDTWQEPNDWRRKGYETAYEVPSLKMARVCMSCARRCHAKRYQRVLFVPRRSADKCSCAQTQHCKARWTQVRCEFDKIADSDESGRGQVDGCIGPQDLRTLITDLRKPIPIMEADTENAILELAGGEEEGDARVDPVMFERWYNKYFKLDKPEQPMTTLDTSSSSSSSSSGTAGEEAKRNNKSRSGSRGRSRGGAGNADDDGDGGDRSHLRGRSGSRGP